MAVYDDQKQNQEKDTDTLPSNDDLRGITGISESEEKEIEDAARSDEDTDTSTKPKLAEAEDGFAREPTGQESSDDEDEPTDFYNPGAAIGSATPFSKFQVMFGKNKKGFLTGGFIGLFMLIIVGGIGSLIPHELLHIKEVVAQNIGGIQEDVLDKRRMRILQKAYFFRDDGKFAGYKQRGTLFSFLDNRKSNRLVTDLENKGYKIDPDTAPDGRWTGKFTRIVGPDGTPINNSDSLWSRRSAIKSAINETYPAKSALWRNRQTALMYQRYGLTRGNWWTDNAATRKMTSAKERLKEKIRGAMFGGNVTNPTIDPARAPADAEGNTDPDRQAKADEINNGVNDALNAEEEARRTGNPTAPLNGDIADEVLDNPAKAFGTSALGVIKITGAADTSCQIIGAANTIAKTSRAAKALQLAKFSSLILAAGDGLKAGKADGKTISDIMIAVNGLDPQTKKNFFGSGGWLSISGKKTVGSTYGTTYNAGGGFTGEIQNLLNTTYKIIGGKGNVKGTCGTLANPFVQVGSAVVGIGAIIFSGGSVGVGQLVVQAGLQAGKFMLLGYGTQLAVKAATGTIVDGTEVGERMGDAFASGAGSLFAMNGSALGFRPLTTTEYAYQQSEYTANQNAKFAALPLKEKLLNTENQNSVSSKAFNAVNEAKNSNVASFIAKIPLMFGSMFSLKTSAAEDSICTQEDIVANKIQTDSFCNPIYGNTDAELDKIDPMDNLIWMYENKYVDENGSPIAGREYAEYVARCFESSTANTLFDDSNDFVSDFQTMCFAAGPNAGSDLYARFRAFRLDQGLLVCLNLYLDQGHCEETAGQTDGAQSTTAVPGQYANASTQQVLDMCNAGGYTDKIKIVCAAANLNGIPYGGTISSPVGYRTKNPDLVGCNGFTNIAIHRATNGKYTKAYCSQMYGTNGVSEKQFERIALDQVEPGDIVIRESSCGCTSSSSCDNGRDSQGRYGHVAVVVSYDKSSGKIVVAEASSKSHPSGVREPSTAQWSPSNIFGFTYGMRYIGGGL